ncbi:unnamed protein product, partial [Pylaiella littoralis]
MFLQDALRCVRPRKSVRRPQGGVHRGHLRGGHDHQVVGSSRPSCRPARPLHQAQARGTGVTIMSSYPQLEELERFEALILAYYVDLYHE